MTLWMLLILVSQIFVLAASKVEKTCHMVSVIHVTLPKLCSIQIVVSDIVDQAVTNLQLNISLIWITGIHFH